MFEHDHPMGAIAFAEARGQVNPESQSNEVVVPADTLEDPPDAPIGPNRRGSARLGFMESGISRSSSVSGFMDTDPGSDSGITSTLF